MEKEETPSVTASASTLGETSLCGLKEKSNAMGLGFAKRAGTSQLNGPFIPVANATEIRNRIGQKASCLLGFSNEMATEAPTSRLVAIIQAGMKEDGMEAKKKLNQ